MKNENLIILAVAAAAVFAVYKFTRTASNTSTSADASGLKAYWAKANVGYGGVDVTNQGVYLGLGK